MSDPVNLRREYALLLLLALLRGASYLSILCTGVALLLYFRLLQTLGALGTASQAYLRAGIGVLLGVMVLGETLSVQIALGLGLAVLGVALINAPRRAVRA